MTRKGYMTTSNIPRAAGRVQGLRRAAQERREPRHALVAAGRAAVDVRLARTAGGTKDAPARAESTAAPVVRSDALDPGKPPVDAERVEIVRKAVENGTYPVIPAKVADAIIAAGFLLRSAK